MKKILKFILIAWGVMMFYGVRSYAVDMDTWTSSNTATADTLKNLCPGGYEVVNGSTVTFGNRGVIHGVCINTAVAGTLTLYNSSATATSAIAAINTNSAIPCYYYDVAVTSGVTYTNSATANTTILYQCY